MIKLSVIVCTKNRACRLLACLKTIVNQTLPAEEFEVIVVDNASVDDTRKMVEVFIGANRTKNIKIVTESAIGHSQARNRGWREACGKYIAYLDDDVVAVPGWAMMIVDAFENNETIPSIVGGKIMPLYESKPPEWFLDSYEIRTWGEKKGFLVENEAKRGFSGANMAVRRELIEKCGGFSLDFGIVGGTFRAGEDTDLCKRIYLIDKNFWYDPAMIVYHRTPAAAMSLKNFFVRSFHCGKSAAFTYKKKMSWAGFFKTWLDFFVKFLFLPFKLIMRGAGYNRIMHALVEGLDDIGFRLGYLVGRKG